MNRSTEIGKIAAALAKAQAEISNPGFDSKNPFFNSRYASLAAVRDAVTPALTKYEIAAVQSISYDPVSATASCLTVLVHASGEWMEFGPFLAPVVPSTNKQGQVLPISAQNVCAATTYLRRYGLMACVCVVGEEDLDGEEGRPNHPIARAPTVPTPDNPNVVGPSQQLNDALKAIDGCNSVDELTSVFRAVTKDRPASFVEGVRARASVRKQELEKTKAAAT
jgi:hypothetical protein